MPNEFYGQPYQAGPNLGNPVLDGIMSLGLAQLHQRGMVPTPLYTNNGNFLDAARARYHDHMRMRAMADARQMDATMLSNALQNAYMGINPGGLTQSQVHTFDAFASGVFRFMGPMWSSSAEGREKLDALSGGLSAQNIANVMEFGGRRFTDPASGATGLNANMNQYLSRSLHENINRVNQYGVRQTYGLSGSMIGYQLGDMMSRGALSTNAPEWMNNARMIDNMQRGYGFNNLSADNKALVAAGFTDPAMRHSSMVYNNELRYEAMRKRDQYAKLDVQVQKELGKVASEQITEIAKQRSGWFTWGTKDVDEAGTYEALTGMSSQTRAIYEGALTDSENAKNSIEASGKGKSLREDMEKYTAEHQAKLDRLNETRDYMSENVKISDDVLGRNMLKIAAATMQGAAFKDADAAQILREGFESMRDGSYADSRYANLSQQDRESLIARAGGNLGNIKAASYGNVDETVAKLDAALGGDASQDAFGTDDLAKSNKPDELARRMQEHVAKRIKKQADDVLKVVGDYSRALKSVGDYTEEEITKFADSMSMRAAYMTDAKSIGGTRLSGRIADSMSRLGLTAEEMSQSVSMNTETFQRYGFVDPSAWSGYGVMTELNSFDFAVTNQREGRRTYGSVGNSQLARFKAVEKAQVDSSYAQNLIATAQRAMALGGDGNEEDAAFVNGMLERAKEGMLTEEDYNAITSGTFKRRIAGASGQSVGVIESMVTDSRANQEAMIKHGTNQNSLGKYGQRRRLRGNARVNRRLSGMLQQEVGGSALRGKVMESMMFAAELAGAEATEDEAFTAGAADLQRRFQDVLDDPNASAEQKTQARNFLSKSEDEQLKMARGLLQSGFDAYDMNLQTYSEFASDSYVDKEKHVMGARQGVRAQFSEIKGGLRVTGMDKLIRKFAELHKSGKLNQAEMGKLIGSFAGADLGGITQEQLADTLKNTDKFINDTYKNPLNKLSQKLAGKDYDELSVDEKAAMAKENREFRLREMQLSGAYEELASLGETHDREMSEKNQSELEGRDAEASNEVNVESIIFNNANIVFEGGTVSGAKSVVRKPNSGGSAKTPDTRG